MRSIISYLVVACVVGAVTLVFAQQRQTPQSFSKVPPIAAPLLQEKHPSPPPADHPATLDLSPEERDNVRVYQQVNRSVVNITTRAVGLDDFLFLAVPRRGSGSGCIIDDRGHILTNYHVIENARQVTVTLFDGSIHDASLVGIDPNNDLAVIKIDPMDKQLHPIRWGNSKQLLVGLRVFAIGNPFGLERTLTTGIISSLNRSLRSENNRLIRGMIQTDAAINPGNSGGPLLNRQGEMIGVTTAIIGRAGQNSGVGLAIPAGTVRRVVDELIRHGRVIRPHCGIFRVIELDEGLLIARLIPNGPAEKAGLRGPQDVVIRRGAFIYRTIDRSKADLILQIDKKKVESFDELLTNVESKKPGEKVVLTVLREGKEINVEVELEEPGN